MLQMDIAGVKRDITNVTLELPMGILSSLNADYDGDCLNIIALLLQSQKNMFTNLRPSSLVISKNKLLIYSNFIARLIQLIVDAINMNQSNSFLALVVRRGSGADKSPVI